MKNSRSPHGPWPTLSLLLVLLLPISPPANADQCQLRRLDVPVTMNGLQPTVTAQIDGADALFVLDSGAFWSTINPAATDQYNLHPDGHRLPGLQVIGVNGRADMKIATVSVFTIFGLPVHKVDFLVGGSDTEGGTVGVLGQNVLRIADIEYDLGQGTVRILKPTDCKKTSLAYWVKPGETFSMMDIRTASAQDPHTTGTAYLNGEKIRVTFDTGAFASIVGLRAAANAGIKPGGPGVERDELITGFGRRRVETWVATFPVLKIGDEEVHNARLHIGELGDLDMLLGADFFLSHHIYVASSQSKLYFTYNGGPVFNLAAAAARAKQTAAAADAPVDNSTLADAPALARRGAAYLARRDFEHALQDYDRACELSPTEATHFYHRGLVKQAQGHSEEGMADIDHAIELKPDYVEALMERATIKLKKDAKPEASKDLDAVDRFAAKGADVRLAAADIYSELANYPASIAQLDLWIASHPQDARLAQALNARCWNRGLLNRGLSDAMDDCKRALRLEPNSAAALDSLGLLYLRIQQFGQAVAQYDAALKINPKQAWTLYCRGVAKSHAGKTQEGAADMSAAVALDPHVTELARRAGLN
jgi:tetratricopeptide (TPR) repeat protein